MAPAHSNTHLKKMGTSSLWHARQKHHAQYLSRTTLRSTKANFDFPKYACIHKTQRGISPTEIKTLKLFNFKTII